MAEIMEEVLAKFAEWVANEKFYFDGVSIWKKPMKVGAIYYTTEQVVDEFLKQHK